MITMIIGVFDISKAIILHQQVINAAHAISLSASLAAVQSNGTTTLTQAQVQTIESSIFAEMPWLRNGIEKGTTSVTLSGIEFSGLPSGYCMPYSTCTGMVPFVAWSVAYRPANAYGVNFIYPTRTCNRMWSGTWNINTTQNIPLSMTNFMNVLRTDGITYTDPIVVADIRHTYSPMFFRFVTGPLDFVASAYWPVRVIPFNSNTLPAGQIGSGQLTTYDLANTDNTLNAHCPGLP